MGLGIRFVPRNAGGAPQVTFRLHQADRLRCNVELGT